MAHILLIEDDSDIMRNNQIFLKMQDIRSTVQTHWNPQRFS